MFLKYKAVKSFTVFFVFKKPRCRGFESYLIVGALASMASTTPYFFASSAVM